MQVYRGICGKKYQCFTVLESLHLINDKYLYISESCGSNGFNFKCPNSVSQLHFLIW